MMAAPTAFLDPNLMLVILIFFFAAAVLGGIDSPVGAVVGGLTLGVLINVLGTYVDVTGGELRLPAALTVLLVLLVRPQGCPATACEASDELAHASAQVDRPGASSAVFVSRPAPFAGEFRLPSSRSSRSMTRLGLNILTGYSGQISLTTARSSG
jgi:ABC-type branched-subunit amino acid transport system permease subunit